MYPLKFGKDPTTGSDDIVQKRKCQANAYTKANANGVHTKNIMSPPHRWGEIILGKMVYFQFSESLFLV